MTVEFVLTPRQCSRAIKGKKGIRPCTDEPHLCDVSKGGDIWIETLLCLKHQASLVKLGYIVKDKTNIHTI